MRIYVVKNTKTGLYWSNKIGWVDRESADEFSYQEREEFSLPVDGKWLRTKNPRNRTSPRPGDPFPCPSCGRTGEWVAEYFQAVSQSVDLVVGENGEPDTDNYHGDEEAYDDGATENESYRCRGCDHIITVGEFRYIPAGQKHDDTMALDKLQRMMSGTTWDGAPDLLEAIADVVRSTGRAIQEVDDDTKSWREFA